MGGCSSFLPFLVPLQPGGVDVSMALGTRKEEVRIPVLPFTCNVTSGK